MIYEKQYISQTEQLMEFYKEKQSRIKEYIVTCHNYISELREMDVMSIYEDTEYEKAFIQLLALVQETYRPDHFISCTSDSLIRIFDDEFIIYMLSVQKQLKKPITWEMLCGLAFNFSIMEIKFKVETGFNSDFTDYAVKKIKLIELWALKN
ncbi:MAG TPA: hypothetical protein VFC65_16990 [Prolixibacteraceae bacterium]|nr:hypothetical protein [Prolixibacteraceae bacterium]